MLKIVFSRRSGHVSLDKISGILRIVYEGTGDSAMQLIGGLRLAGAECAVDP